MLIPPRHLQQRPRRVDVLPHALTVSVFCRAVPSVSCKGSAITDDCRRQGQAHDCRRPARRQYCSHRRWLHPDAVHTPQNPFRGKSSRVRIPRRSSLKPPPPSQQSSTSLPRGSASAPSSFSALRQLYSSGGIKSLWRGAVPTALRDAPGAGLFIVFYERGRRILGIRGDGGGGAVGGGVAGELSLISSSRARS
jgi:hypothetical protein